MAKNKFYIATSIAYTNANPHIGFALELIQADVLARYHREKNEDVFFLTGTDEHGQKIAKAAEIAGKTPKDLTDELSGKFRLLCEKLNLSNDDFIRTSDRIRHWPPVSKIWEKLKESGDIYKKKYQGFYCVGCEAFITKKDLEEGKCRVHLREPEVIEEENYFFKLSKYSEKIKNIIESDEVKIIPEGRKNEMLSFVKQGLEDVSFSRPSKDLKWGIPVPGDNSQTIYVWADALINYISVLDYPDGEKFKKFWPIDVHFLGKDILRFHSTIWLGMLLSAGLELPKNIFVHGFITSGGQKMSKSLGNVVDPFELISKYGADALRYFLLREIPPSDDGDFTDEKFQGRYNADLAGGLGNLVARVLKLAENNNLKFQSGQKPGQKFQEVVDETEKNHGRLLGEYKFNEALISIWELISYCDKYVNDEKPWSLDYSSNKEKVKEIISNLLFAIGKISELIGPFLPETSERIFKQLENKGDPLFPRIL